MANSKIVLPNYQAHSLAGVMPAVAAALGAPLPHGNLTGLAFPQVERVVIVLCDGLGWHNLQECRAHAPFLRNRFWEMQRLTTSFPSTTAVAIPMFGTGCAPGLTNMVGYTVRNPENGYLVNLVPWTQVPDPTIVATPVGNSQSPRFEIGPKVFQPEPAIFSHLMASGIKVTCVGSAKFAGSGMSLASFGKTGYAVAEQSSERVPVILRQLKQTNEKQLIYLYWGEVDKAGHAYGPDSNAWADAITDFDSEFAKLVKSAPANTLVIMTADHGQVVADTDQQIDVATTPTLARDVALVAGEARAAHVYLQSGVDLDIAAARWREYLGNRAQVWTRDEAISIGLFGTVRAQVAPWIGDLVVAALGRTTIVDSRTQTSNSLTLKGVHGSLSPTEMEVPLLAVLR